MLPTENRSLPMVGKDTYPSQAGFICSFAAWGAYAGYADKKLGLISMNHYEFSPTSLSGILGLLHDLQSKRLWGEMLPG